MEGLKVAFLMRLELGGKNLLVTVLKMKCVCVVMVVVVVVVGGGGIRFCTL